MIINDVRRTLLIGCPNKMTAESTHQDFLKFFRYGKSYLYPAIAGQGHGDSR